MYEEAAGAEYWRLQADAYRDEGNEAAAALCERIALTPNGGRDLLTTHEGKRVHKKQERPQHLLREYEVHMRKNCHLPEREAQERFAEQHGLTTRKAFTDWLRRARRAQEKLTK